jgi:hypothetical protein
LSGFRILSPQKLTAISDFCGGRFRGLRSDLAEAALRGRAHDLPKAGGVM